MIADSRQRFLEVKRGGALPSPQGVALAIARLALADDVGTVELTRLIKTDPAMAGRLLRYANAAHGGSRRHIASLTQAVVFLGLHRVRQLALAFSLVDAYRAGHCSAFDYQRYWAQSLATGVGAQIMTGLAQMPPEECFTCGLLSGVGRLGLASAFPNEYAAILAGVPRPADHGPILCSAEMQAFGLDHLALAREMLLDWGLPSLFADAVRHHEDPDQASFAPGSRADCLSRVLNLAAAFARLLADGAIAQSRDDAPALYHAAARAGLEADQVAPTLARIGALWVDWGRELKLQTPHRDVSELLAETPAGDGLGALIVLPMRVALIGADSGLLRTLGNWLRNLGQEIVIVGDWPATEAQVRIELPDVLLVDARNGAVEASRRVREIRRAEAPHHGFFVALVRREDELLVPELIRAGADDYLPLPPSEAAFETRMHAAQHVFALQGAVHAEREAAIRHSSEWARSNRRLLHEALTDPLTQLSNRRYGLDHLAQECTFAGEAKLPLVVMMLDIDHFKRVNDRFGHEVGDEVLRRVAALVKRNCRKDDVVFRYGGEEFCVICPATGIAAAAALAGRILEAVRGTAIGRDRRLHVTISAGIAARASGCESPEQVIARADAALYTAKNRGRDRVCVADPGSGETA